MATLTSLQAVVNTKGLQDPANALAICYGSTVRDGSTTSDLDMLIVERSASADAWRTSFTESLISLHTATGRMIDLEVPYQNKLFYTVGELACSLSHTMFWEGGAFAIKTFEGSADDDPYFASPDMKLRLGLNAFSSAHVFLGGNKAWHSQLGHAATISLGHLAAQIVGPAIETAPFTEIKAALVTSSDGASYKDFLGYHPADMQFSQALESGVGDVRQQAGAGNPVLGVDGQLFLHGRVQNLLAGLLDNS
ncbi:MAG: hypothetical protein AAB834_02230 [Patescibacteria group bacterium]